MAIKKLHQQVFFFSSWERREKEKRRKEERKKREREKRKILKKEKKMKISKDKTILFFILSFILRKMVHTESQ